MNVKRGLFRLWLVAAALFAISTVAISCDIVANEFDAAAASKHWDAVSREALPINCQLARGKRGADFVETKPWEEYQSPPKPDACWYTMEALRRLYPEYADLQDDEIRANLYRLAGLSVSGHQPWMLVSQVASVAFGVPVAVLAFGAALAWALAGFSRKSERER